VIGKEVFVMSALDKQMLCFSPQPWRKRPYPCLKLKTSAFSGPMLHRCDRHASTQHLGAALELTACCASSASRSLLGYPGRNQYLKPSTKFVLIVYLGCGIYVTHVSATSHGLEARYTSSASRSSVGTPREETSNRENSCLDCGTFSGSYCGIFKMNHPGIVE
jgi:hypothetical protein